jgi:hypothetical protein
LTGVQLHGLVLVAERLGEDKFAELFGCAPPEFWRLIRRLSLRSGQVEQQIEAGADPAKVRGGCGRPTRGRAVSCTFSSCSTSMP